MKLLKPRTILLGGLAVAAVAGALKNRDKVAGLIGVRSSAPEPWSPSAPAGPADPPPPANVDLPREEAGSPVPPVSTTTDAEAATVADLEDVETDEAAAPVIDEAAEEAAAAAEAAAIGGTSPSYAGIESGRPASEEERAVVEAGGGESEGAEQAEADLVSNVDSHIGEPQPGYAQITDAIQAEDSPGRWEQVEPLASNAPEKTEDELEQEARQSASRPMLASEPGHDAPAPADTDADADPEATADVGTDIGGESAGDSGVLEPPEDSGISSAPSWGERFRARVRERDEAKARESGIMPAPDETETGADGPEAEAGAEPAAETPAAEKSGAVWQSPQEEKPADAIGEPPGSLLAPDEQPTVEADSLKSDDDDGSEWQTWSGRAVEP